MLLVKANFHTYTIGSFMHLSVHLSDIKDKDRKEHIISPFKVNLCFPSHRVLGFVAAAGIKFSYSL